VEHPNTYQIRMEEPKGEIVIGCITIEPSTFKNGLPLINVESASLPKMIPTLFFFYEKQLSFLSTSVTRMASRRTSMTTRCKNKG